MPTETDVLVIGSGIAGTTAACGWPGIERQVTVITRAQDPEESNTRYAQGGIVARGPHDSAELLIKDILRAGAGLSPPGGRARLLAEEGAALVEQLLIEELGVPFDRTDDGDALLHSRGRAHRLAHPARWRRDGPGHRGGPDRRLQALPNVDLAHRHDGGRSHHLLPPQQGPHAVYAPITCHGAYVLDRATGEVNRFLAKATVLATGGIGRIYRHSSNPKGARGGGLAMAYRAGARVINAEYVQFHPRPWLCPGPITSSSRRRCAARVGGCTRRTGATLWTTYAPNGAIWPPATSSPAPSTTRCWSTLSPRLAGSGLQHGQRRRFPERFPTIYQTCMEAGIDITQEPIPVVPAAHYFCGGVHVDVWGCTTLRGLYAVGEVSCTGVHGANRLASTSLLEGLVWGDRAGRHIAERSDLRSVAVETIPPWEPPSKHAVADPVLLTRDARAIQNIMWLYVGLARNTHRLSRALNELDHLWGEVDTFYRATRLDDNFIGLRNMAQVAWIVTNAAWHNRQSRGAHYREDAQTHAFASLHDTDGPLPNSLSE